ncbi:ACT domain-containing protein [Tautonia sp. JC769]|uniref:ACT domain-containing protein n=1 Tax=Tautonia sp. JC769 TaxID=3232135 RepID=UPI003459D58E
MTPTPSRLSLVVHPGEYTVARLGPDAPTPSWAVDQPAGLVSLTRTPAELSIVCPTDCVPPEVRAERGWRLLEVEGPLPFEMTGVLASIADPLAEEGVNIFVISTFETDFILVPDRRFDHAIASLLLAGHSVQHV